MIDIDELIQVRDRAEAITEQLCLYYREQFSKLAIETVADIVGDEWRRIPTSTQKGIGQNLYADLFYTMSGIRLVVGYDNYEGVDYTVTMPFESLNPNWFLARDVKVRTSIALENYYAAEKKRRAREESKEADKARRRAEYEKLRKEFEDEQLQTGNSGS